MGSLTWERCLRTIHTVRDGYAAAVAALRRSVLIDDPQRESIVRGIIADVRERGDAVLLELGRRFDCPSLSSLEVSSEEWDAACAEVDSQSRTAVETAAASITLFHEEQKRASWQVTRD